MFCSDHLAIQLVNETEQLHWIKALAVLAHCQIYEIKSFIISSYLNKIENHKIIVKISNLIQWIICFNTIWNKKKWNMFPANLSSERRSADGRVIVRCVCWTVTMGWAKSGTGVAVVWCVPDSRGTSVVRRTCVSPPRDCTVTYQCIPPLECVGVRYGTFLPLEHTSISKCLTIWVGVRHCK